MKSLNRIGLAFLFSTQLSLSRFAQFGFITTVGGNGTRGFSGDGGLATSAQLSYPYGVVVDADRNLYIGDTGNNCVRKVTPTGLITTVAGNGFGGFTGDGGPAISAQLNQPYGVAVDDAGNLYVADSDSDRIRKVQAVSGVMTFFPQVAVGVGGSLTGVATYEDVVSGTVRLAVGVLQSQLLQKQALFTVIPLIPGKAPGMPD